MMRFKIKQVQPSPESQHQQQQQQQQENQEILKKEAVEVMEEEHNKGTPCQLLKSAENDQPSSSKSSDTNHNVSNQLELLPTTPVSQNLGKRTRRPKFVDEISPVTIRRRKKKPYDSKSAQVIPDSEGKSTNKKEKANGGMSMPVQIKSPTLIRAEELQSSLGNEYPCFVKLLVRSHVGSCFWMGLPVPFCKSHLPKKDAITILESENVGCFEVKYIADKTGLSAGWRKFVAAHKLVEGDVLTFQLIGPTTFKVYVTRANDLNEVDGALSLLNLETLTKQSDADLCQNGKSDGTVPVSNTNKQLPKSLPLTLVQQKKKQKPVLPRRLVPHAAQLEEQSGNDSEEVGSEVMENTKCSDDAVPFQDVKNFNDFRIVVNGVCIDSELPEHIRKKYYELCCSKNCFLHEGFLSGLHCKLAAAMIFEAVNTADAIRACKVTTPRKEFEKWDKSLESFELLGMNIGFVRDRLSWLISLAFDAEEAVETKRYWEVKTQRARINNEIKKLEAKLLELLEASEKYDADIDFLKPKAESYELMFQEEVNAPW